MVIAVEREPSAVLEVLLEDGVEPAAADVFHDEEVAVAVLAERVDLHDVRAAHGGQRARLLLEAGGDAGVAHPRGRDDLHGDAAIEADVAREVHDPHAADAELGLDFVASVDDRRGELDGAVTRTGHTILAAHPRGFSTDRPGHVSA